MPQPRYITSDSQMIAPGVYIKENAPAVPIRGQRNRLAGFGGQCVRGPVNKLVMCRTYNRFVAVFGERDKNSGGGAILGHVWKALQGKKWGPIGVVRVAAAAAVKASFTLETAAAGGGTAVVRIDAANPGTWGNDVYWRVTAASNGDANYWNLEIKLYGKVKVYQNIVTTTLDNTNTVIGSDDATLIRLSKLASGRPVNNAATVDGADADGWTKLGQTVTAFTSVAGTDGTIADSDYSTTTVGAIDILNSYVGLHAVAIVGRSNSTTKSAIEAVTGSTSQRVWFVCPDSESVTYDDAIDERAAISSGRMTYWFNHVYITDPVTKEEIVEEPFLLPMSIVTQTDPDIHVGDFDNAVLTKAARRAYAELGPDIRDALTTGGVSFMLHDQDANANDVMIPGHAVTCDFAVNNRDLDGRYMKDFILDALAHRLQGDQFKGNTPANRANRASACSTFLADLARTQRYVQTNSQGVPQFQYVNDDSVNDENEQAEGTQKELCIVKLIPKNIRIELNATIGVDATISEQ